MPPALRFHLDENLTTKIALALRKRGRDCTTSRDAGLISATDEQQWEYAAGEQRIIITADQDFLRMAAIDMDHPGSIFWTKRASRPFGQLVKAIDEMCYEKTADELRGTVTFI
jgi:predicted nuclease of predicted toxin-antitoxin system